MLKSLCVLALAMISVCAFSQGAATVAAPPLQIVTERGVAMKTRDGVTLRADIYRPAAEGSYPVLLTRTPYDKQLMWPIGQKGAGRGFIVVIQDVRGRYTSEGDWYPFKYETNDGYDTVEWAAALPHSNGKVGMFSGSYVGATQMLAAIAHPPHCLCCRACAAAAWDICPPRPADRHRRAASRHRASSWPRPSPSQSATAARQLLRRPD